MGGFFFEILTLYDKPRVLSGEQLYRENLRTEQEIKDICHILEASNQADTLVTLVWVGCQEENVPVPEEIWAKLRAVNDDEALAAFLKAHSDFVLESTFKCGDIELNLAGDRG